MFSFFITILMCIANIYYCLENLSRRKTTNILQISTYQGHEAALADDWNLDFNEPNCSRTNTNQTQTRLQVDLGKPYSLSNVRIHRRDVYKSNSMGRYRRGRFYLDVSEFSATTSTTKQRIRCYIENRVYQALPINMINIPCKYTARYVIVETKYNAPEEDSFSEKGLEICKIEVYGCEIGRYGYDCRPCRGCLTCDVRSGFCNQDSSYPIIQLSLFFGLSFLFMVYVLFCRIKRGNKCLFKRVYTPKHDISFSTCNPGQTNEMTTTPLTHANLQQCICNKFNYTHSTRLDMQTELQTCITSLLKKRFLAQQESTQAETSSQKSINENSSNCDHVSYENVHEVECVVNNSNPQKTIDEEVHLSTCKQCYFKRGLTSRSEKTTNSRLSTNETHSDGKFYEDLSKDDPDLADYEELTVTETILDSEIRKQFVCEKDYATQPAKETSILNEERVSNSDFYFDVPSLNCYENLDGDDCYEEEPIYELPAQPEDNIKRK
uniref:Uncharacterized protein n=1 Tax=Magallana gigas TaxID=29159 RepID=A0A8W8P2G4_MAGGI